MPIDRSAVPNEATTSPAMLASDAFMIAAFSRSSRPSRPSELDNVTAASGMTSQTMSRAICSCASLTEANTDEIATDRTPAACIASAACADLGGSDCGNLAAVVVVAAVGDRDMTAHFALQRCGPIGERWQARGGGGGEPDRADAREGARLDECIREVRRADHDRADSGGRNIGLAQHLDERRLDAGADVGRRRRLDGGEHVSTSHDDRVGVRATDVDPDPIRAALPTQGASPHTMPAASIARALRAANGCAGRWVGARRVGQLAIESRLDAPSATAASRRVATPSFA